MDDRGRWEELVVKLLEANSERIEKMEERLNHLGSQVNTRFDGSNERFANNERATNDMRRMVEEARGIALTSQAAMAQARKTQTDFEVANVVGRWQFFASTAPGLLALGGVVAAIVVPLLIE